MIGSKDIIYLRLEIAVEIAIYRIALRKDCTLLNFSTNKVATSTANGVSWDKKANGVIYPRKPTHDPILTSTLYSVELKDHMEKSRMERAIGK